MYTRDSIIHTLKVHKPDLVSRYPISELGIFGSYSRGDQTAESDIDILVDFDKSIDGFQYIRLAHELEDIFDIKIDIVSRKAIKPGYLPYVERNLIHV